MSARRKQQPSKASRRIAMPALPWRQFGQMLLLAVVSLMLLAIFWFGMQQLGERLRQPITDVVVQGEFRYLQQEAIRAAVAPVIRGGFFAIDMQQVHGALLDIPWVASASVRRIWPSTLLLVVEEHQPSLRWGQTQLVSRRGEIFMPDDITPFMHLVQLDASEKYRDDVLLEYRRMTALLRPFGKLVYLSLSPRGSWVVQLEDGLTIDLGSKDVAERLQRALRFMHHLDDQLPLVQRIDARYSNGVAVILRKQEDSMTTGASTA